MLSYTEKYISDLAKITNSIPNVVRLKNKKILITGAGGLICSAIVDFLMELNRESGWCIQVYAGARKRESIARRFKHWQDSNALHFLQYDACEAFRTDIDFDYIIHGASNATPNAYISQPVETMLANIIGIKNALDYIREQGTGRVLYISSSEVYGKKKENTAYDESDYGYLDILNPRACYPSSKRAAETLCASYKKQYDVDCVIVRPGHIYGQTMTDSDNRAASQFSRDAKNGKDIIMKSAGTQLRSYCHVLDCASAILAVLLNGASGEAYNISNPESVVTIRQLAECIAEAANVKLVFECPTDEEKSSYNMMENSALTSDKLQALGWKGLFSLADSVNATLESIEQ